MILLFMKLSGRGCRVNRKSPFEGTPAGHGAPCYPGGRSWVLPTTSGGPRWRAASLLRLAGAALGVGILFGCGDEGPEYRPGVRTAVVVSPAGVEGAALVELRGPGIEGVSPVEGRVFHHARADTVRVIVVRDDAGELRFAVALADTLNPPRGTVLEVADAGNELRSTVSAYDVEIRP